MKLTDLIVAASKALEEHGDIPVIVHDSGCGCCSFGFVNAETAIRPTTRVDLENDIPVAFLVKEI